MAFNGGGSALARRPGDPLTAKFADPAVRDAFGYVNHTYDHPNLDCSTASFIRRQITDNLAWARAHGLPVATPTRSSPASTPGSRTRGPATPARSTRRASTRSRRSAGGGAVPAGTYDYALTARSPAGETVASVEPGVVVGRAPAPSR